MSTIMNYVKRLFGAKHAKPPSNIEERVSWLLKPYMSSVNDILTWKNPIISISFVAIINLIFWLICLFEIRPFGLIGAILLCAILLDALATFLGAGRKPSNLRCRSSNGDKLFQLIAKTRQWLSVTYVDALQLRRDNPSKFCIITCCFCGLIYFMGNTMGPLLWHILITLFLLSPLLPNIQSTISSMQSNADSDGDVEEFLPNITQTVIEELEKAGEAFQEWHEPLSLNAGDLSLPNDANTALLLKAAGEIESSDDDDDDVNTNLLHKKNVYPSLPSTSDSSDEEFADKTKNKVVITRAEIITTDIPVEHPPSGWLHSVFGSSVPSAKYDSDEEFELIDERDL